MHWGQAYGVAIRPAIEKHTSYFCVSGLILVCPLSYSCAPQGTAIDTQALGFLPLTGRSGIWESLAQLRLL